jgi:hypothetical protein
MMKKLKGILLVALLVFAAAGQAMAYFEEGHLYQVVYSTVGTEEVATDMGLLGDLSAGLNVFTNVDIGDFGSATYADLYVAYWAFNQADEDIWASGPTSGLTSGARKGSSTLGAMTGVKSYYSSFGTQKVLADQGNPQSYISLLNKSGLTTGQLAGFLSSGNVEESLGALAATGGFVDQILYLFDSPNSAAAGLDTDITLRTQVPVPATLLLLISGLLGVFGIRRKR